MRHVPLTMFLIFGLPNLFENSSYTVVGAAVVAVVNGDIVLVFIQIKVF